MYEFAADVVVEGDGVRVRLAPLRAVHDDLRVQGPEALADELRGRLWDHDGRGRAQPLARVGGC
jgi:hypothetical protein